MTIDKWRFVARNPDVNTVLSTASSIPSSLSGRSRGLLVARFLVAAMNGLSSACRGSGTAEVPVAVAPFRASGAELAECQMVQVLPRDSSLERHTFAQGMLEWYRSAAKALQRPMVTLPIPGTVPDSLSSQSVEISVSGHQLTLVIVYPPSMPHTAFVGVATDGLAITAVRGTSGGLLDAQATESWGCILAPLSQHAGRELSSTNALQLSLLFISWASGYSVTVGAEDGLAASRLWWRPTYREGPIPLPVRDIQLAPISGGGWAFQGRMDDRTVRLHLNVSPQLNVRVISE